MTPDPLLQAALRCPRPGDEPPADLLPLLLAQAPASLLSRQETLAWAAAPLLAGAALALWVGAAFDVHLDALPLSWVYPLSLAALLHAAWPRDGVRR